MSICIGETGKVEVCGDHWKVLLLRLPALAMLLSRCALCPGPDRPSFLLCHMTSLCSRPWVCVSQDCQPGTVLSHPMSINVGCTGGKHPRKEFCVSCQAVKEKVNLDKACTWNLNIILTSKTPQTAKFFRQEEKCNQRPCRTHLCASPVTILHYDLWLVQKPAGSHAKNKTKVGGEREPMKKRYDWQKTQLSME